jgi:hypothetical protein
MGQKRFTGSCSTIRAEDVWEVIRPFDHYGWAGVQGETIIDNGKADDQVGAVRRFTNGETTIRQVLLAHSDVERCFTHANLRRPTRSRRSRQARHARALRSKGCGCLAGARSSPAQTAFSQHRADRTRQMRAAFAPVGGAAGIFRPG